MKPINKWSDIKSVFRRIESRTWSDRNVVSRGLIFYRIRANQLTQMNATGFEPIVNTPYNMCVFAFDRKICVYMDLRLMSTGVNPTK